MVEKKIEIVYEDDQVLVLNKPADVVSTLEGKKGKDLTVEEWLRSKVAKGLLRNGLAHRLDKGTSGLLVVGRNEESLRELKRQFRERQITKKYLAMVGGEAVAKGVVEAPIGRKFLIKFGVKTGGKRARTEFVLIDKYKRDGRIYSLMEVQTKTGRTHQIRVHFSYLGWPLLGDVVYGGEAISTKRPFLHAYCLELDHPTEGRRLNLELALPDDLVKELGRYEKV